MIKHSAGLSLRMMTKLRMRASSLELLSSLTGQQRRVFSLRFVLFVSLRFAKQTYLRGLVELKGLWKGQM